jgi:hypothetical protein
VRSPPRTGWGSPTGATRGSGSSRRPRSRRSGRAIRPITPMEASMIYLSTPGS